jgi:Flp pilus assembly protein TadD
MVVLAMTLVILPVTLRNRARGGAWVLVSANGGINFYLGNNADWQRTWMLRPGLEWEELVRRIPPQERLGQARWDRYFGSQALRWLAREPLHFFAALGRKAVQSCSWHELDRNLDPEGFRQRSLVQRWAPRYACLAPWLLLGALWAWRRAGPARLAVLFGLCVHATMALVFVNERYRLDAAAASLPLAAIGVAAGVASLRRQPESMHRMTCAALVALGSLLAYVDWGGLGAVRGPHAPALEGMAYYIMQRYERAGSLLQQAVDDDPEDADATYQLGTVLQKLNRPDAALQAYERAAQLVPGHPKPAMAAGWVLRQQGHLAEALRRYEWACKQDSTNAMVQLETASLLEEMGRRDAARQRYTLAVRHSTNAAQVEEARRGLARMR